jgi:hypothetical protein
VDLSSGEKGVREEHAGKIGIHPLVKVRPPGKEISNRVRHTGNVLQGVVEVLQKLDPPGLAARDLLQLTEILEVFMVGADVDWMLSTEEKQVATLETENDAKKFLIMGVIIGLRREETPGMKGDGVKSILIFLGDDNPKSVT